MKRLLFLLLLSQSVALAFAQRSETMLSDGWYFLLGDALGAEAIDYDDSRWQRVSVPHDWAIHKPFDRNNDLQSVRNIQNGEKKVHLKTGRTGGLPYMGKGWYRRHFTVKTAGRTWLYFDGAMSRAHVYVNGQQVAFQPYGYGAFSVDITEMVCPGDNVLAVSIDNPAYSSRWYPGAGLFRPVTLVETGASYVPQWGIQVTTPVVKSDYAIVKATVSVNSNRQDSLTICSEVVAPNGDVVQNYTQQYAPTSQLKAVHHLRISHPKLWSVDSPSQYTLRTKISVQGKVTDETTTSFGIRNIEYIPHEGFFLNGQHTKIKGVCVHHDLGALGAAVDKDAIRMRLKMLKDMGCNAIRTSHNLPSSMLVELCSEMGLMLMIEPFDEWDAPKCENGFHHFFAEEADNVLRNMVRHFRNAPCVILWGIGNEVPNQRDEKGFRMVEHLQAIVHAEDHTRPVTVCMDQIPYVLKNGFAAPVDIPGINYNTWNYDKAWKQWDQGLVLGSETASTVSSRGVYKFPLALKAMATYSDHQSSGYDTEYCSWSNVPDVDFALSDDNPWYIGQFVWTGFDYLGEPTPYNNDAWPSHSSLFGIIDLANLPKDRYYLYRSVWNTDSHTLHVLPHWTWPGREGQVTPVMVYTDYPEAELFVNGKSMGRQKKCDNAPSESDSLAILRRYRLIWDHVRYEPGTIEVVAYDGHGKIADKKKISTAGRPAAIQVSSVREGLLTMFTVTITDKNGNLCPQSNNLINVTVRGKATFCGMANGDPTCLTSLGSRQMPVFGGQLTFFVRNDNMTGKNPAVVKITSKGLPTYTETIYNQ